MRTRKPHVRHSEIPEAGKAHVPSSEKQPSVKKPQLPPVKEKRPSVDKEVAIHNIRLPKQSMVEDVINELKAKKKKGYDASEKYLGLEHSDIAPKRSNVVNQVAAAASIPEKRPTNKPGNEASRKKHKPESQDSTKASESRFDKMATSFLEMLEDDKDPSSLSLRDFSDISSNNLVDVGFFAVPPSLVSYAKDLLANRPDIGNGKDQSPLMNEMAFVVLCCVLKSMDTTHLNELTKSLILKWRDAIRCALQSGFKVDFLMDHLKFVARAYLAKLARNSKEDKELLDIDEKLNEQLDTLKARRAEMYKNVYSELRKICEAAAEKFPGETFGSFYM